MPLDKSMHADHICCQLSCNKESLIASPSPSWQDGEQQAFKTRHRGGITCFLDFLSPSGEKRKMHLLIGKCFCKKPRASQYFTHFKLLESIIFNSVAFRRHTYLVPIAFSAVAFKAFPKSTYRLITAEA